MSEPKRYDPHCNNCGRCDMDEWSMGSYVPYADYEKLQAENTRLRNLFAETNRLFLLDGDYEAAQAGTYNKLSDQIRVLINAGDRMDLAISTPDSQAIERHTQMKMTDREMLAIKAWRAAKERNR